jgi:hypothetical protein
MAAKKRRSKTVRKTPVSSNGVTGSPEAMKLAVGILETLAGLSSPSDTSEALGVSVNRYYQLEARGLQGLVSAMEPLPRGRALTPERERARLQAENDRLQKELLRYQALVRTAQRTIGLAKKAPPAAGSKRGRRPRTRAKTVLRTLRPKARATSTTETSKTSET